MRQFLENVLLQKEKFGFFDIYVEHVSLSTQPANETNGEFLCTYAPFLYLTTLLNMTTSILVYGMSFPFHFI